LSHDLTDLNGDKILDMVTGQGENGVNYDEKVYYGGGGSNPDTKKPIFRAIETPAPLTETATAIRYALRDNVTNEQGQMIKATSVTYNLAGGTPKTVPGKFYGGDLFRAYIPAQAAGAVVTYKINATDRAGLTATSPSFTYTVPTPVPPPVVIGVGGSGAGGSGSAGASAAGAGGAATGSGGSGGAMAGTGGTAGTGVAGAGEAGSGEEAGEAGETSVGGRSSAGTAGKPSTGGKAGSSSAGAGNGEAGETGTAGSGGNGHYETVDDGGCSVSSSMPATKGRGAALLGLGLTVLGFMRRRRNGKP
jgi:MYXO-CTERM domain-containing protein